MELCTFCVHLKEGAAIMFDRTKLCDMFFMVKGQRYKHCYHQITTVKEFSLLPSYLTDFRRTTAFPLGRLRGNYYV